MSSNNRKTGTGLPDLCSSGTFRSQTMPLGVVISSGGYILYFCYVYYQLD
jgi:hypothetical protein